MGRGINVWTCSDMALNAYEMESWKEINTTLLFPPYLTFIPLPWSHFSRYSCTRWLVMILLTDCLWSDHTSAGMFAWSWGAGTLLWFVVSAITSPNCSLLIQSASCMRCMLTWARCAWWEHSQGSWDVRLPGWFSSKTEGVCSFQRWLPVLSLQSNLQRWQEHQYSQEHEVLEPVGRLLLVFCYVDAEICSFV